MSQTRIWNFGDTFTSKRAIDVSALLGDPGVYSGFDVSVTEPDTLTLSPGWVKLPSGLFVGESAPTSFRVFPLPAAATNYTLVVRHTDSDVIGGQPALYTVETGLLTSISDGVALAYVRYPGGAVPFSLLHVTPVRKVLSQAEDSPHLVPTSLVPPFQPRWISTSVGANTLISDLYVSPNFYTRVSTDGLGPVPPAYETTVVRLPLLARRFRPVSIVVTSRIDSNCQLLVSMLDTDNNTVSLTGSTLGPSPTFSASTISVNPGSGVFTEGDMYTVSLTFRTPSLASIDLKSVIITYDPLP